MLQKDRGTVDDIRLLGIVADVVVVRVRAALSVYAPRRTLSPSDRSLLRYVTMLP
jgi:hypothetical protein